MIASLEHTHVNVSTVWCTSVKTSMGCTSIHLAYNFKEFFSGFLWWHVPPVFLILGFIMEGKLKPSCLQIDTSPLGSFQFSSEMWLTMAIHMTHPQSLCMMITKSTSRQFYPFVVYISVSCAAPVRSWVSGWRHRKWVTLELPVRSLEVFPPFVVSHRRGGLSFVIWRKKPETIPHQQLYLVHSRVSDWSGWKDNVSVCCCKNGAQLHLYAQREITFGHSFFPPVNSWNATFFRTAFLKLFAAFLPA